MKFYTEDLKKILPTVLQAIPPKSTLPMLEHFLFTLIGNELTIIGSNQEVTVKVSHMVEGEEDGSLLVPARKFNDIVKTLDGFEFIADGTDITVKTSNGKYSMKGLDSDEYLDLENHEYHNKIQFDGTQLSKVLLAVSQDEYRPAMTGVLLEIINNELNLVATDSFKLVRVKSATNAENVEMILNKEFCNIIKKYPNIELYYNDKVVRADIEMVSITTQLINEKFPPYAAVIPKPDLKIELNNGELLKAVQRASLFSNDTAKNIKIEFNEGCKVTASDLDSQYAASETIECIFNDTPFEIGFNHNNLISLLNIIDTETITIEYIATNKPILLSNNELLALIMPVRV